MQRFLFIVGLLSGAVSLSISARAADTEQFVSKARAAVGSEAAINGLTSIHYVGTIQTTEEPADAQGKRPAHPIEMIFQKPYRQRVQASVGNGQEVTALDDLEAWMMKSRKDDPSNWTILLLQKEQVRRLRTNTWEMFAYYRGIEQVGGTMKDFGEVTMDGVKYRKITYAHDNGVTFIRYFDPASGKLLLTETEQGARIREDGDLVVNGLHFAKRIISSNKTADGKERVVTVTFDKVSVNEQLSDDLFAVPMMPTK